MTTGGSLPSLLGEKVGKKSGSVDLQVTDYKSFHNSLFEAIYMPEDLVKKHVSDLGWYSYLNNNHTKPIDRENLTKIITGIHELMRHQNFNYINTLTTKVISENSSVDAIICILRASFVSRNQINGWKKLLANAQTWLQKKGYNPTELLRGLSA